MKYYYTIIRNTNKLKAMFLSIILFALSNFTIAIKIPSAIVDLEKSSPIPVRRCAGPVCVKRIRSWQIKKELLIINVHMG